MAEPIDYKAAGVDLDTYEQTMAKLPPLLRRTYTPRVLDWPGGFAGLFRLDDNVRLLTRTYRDPVLVASTDGVGTKLKLAFAMNRHDTIGIDLVAMSVNDVLVQGAEPLFFLDYFAVGKLDVATAAAVVSGIGEGCRQAGCALIGGETAEMPGMYADGEYDLAGFCVGGVEKSALITGGGLIDNPPRILPEGLAIRLRRGSWEVPKVFPWLQTLGSVPDAEMFRVFNMGIGLTLIVADYYAEAIARYLREEIQLPAWVIGEVVSGNRDVTWA
jgi:phosphoribosylaminoimidazole (AIR) synthetase